MRLQQTKKFRASYPRGVGSTGRRFAMKQQLRLLEKALASWPRRQAPLLEVNCGNGAFLPFLWQCGFDVQGTEIDPALRQNAQKAKVPGLEIYAATDNDLPFDNDSFDWVILHLKNSAASSIRSCAIEGIRIAKRGFMLTFWNSSSLPAFFWRCANKKDWAVSAAPWRLVWEQLHACGTGRITSLSALSLPGCAWHDPWPGGGIHIGGAPLGAWCVLRLDMGESHMVTPMPLRLGAPLQPSAEIVMEYTQKSSEQVKK